MLEMPELWDPCRGELLTRAWNQPKRKKCAAVSNAGRSWRSEEHFDIRRGDAEFGVCPAGFQSCFGPVFPHYAPFPTFWNDNVYPVPVLFDFPGDYS